MQCAVNLFPLSWHNAEYVVYVKDYKSLVYVAVGITYLFVTTK